MSWIIVRMNLKDNQTKVRRINLNKFVLGIVRGGQFFYKSTAKGYRCNFDCYSAFSPSSFFDPFLLGSSL